MADVFSTPVQVNTADATNQNDPQIITLSSGKIAVVWADASDGSVKGRVYDADGSNPGAILDLTNGATGTQSEPAIAATDDGGFVVSFTDLNPTEPVVEVRKFSVDASNALSSAWASASAQTVDGDSGSNFDGVGQSDIIVLDDGNILVAVAESSTVAGAGQIAFQILSADGQTLRQQGTLMQQGGDELSPSVIQLTTGEIVTFAHTETSATIQNVFGATALYNDTTATITDISGRQQFIFGVNKESLADLTPLAGGQFVGVWQEVKSDGSEPQISIIVHGTNDGDSNPATASLITNVTDLANPSAGRRWGTGDPNDNTAPVVLALNDGGFAVFWTDETDGSIEAIFFDSSFVPRSQSFLIPGSVFGTSTPSRPAISQLNDGRIAIAYVDDDAGDEDIGLIIFDAFGSGTITGTSAGETLIAVLGDSILAALGGDDTLIGLGGNDLLDGGAGDDDMEGSTGDDTYIVDSALDTVTEQVGEGTDSVRIFF
ncbi:MAG: hypothetical protein AAFX39_08575, partial [Pseudomonadota bacterium]